MSELTLSYSGFSGNLEIRTKYRGDEVLFSLPDLVHVLAKENTAISENEGIAQGFSGLMKASIEVLEEDEKETTFSDSGNHEVYVTEPGLYRVVSRDSSPASKKFQRWMFHEVLPSIRKYGTYPPLIKPNVSDVKQLTLLFLKEIEEREALGRQVQEHDYKINEISNKLEKISVSEHNGYITIQERLDFLEIANMNQEHIWAWCEKIRLEEQYDCKKSLTGNKFDAKYPPVVIDKAIGMLNSF
jgi:prophage antirepressor-like protein